MLIDILELRHLDIGPFAAAGRRQLQICSVHEKRVVVDVGDAFRLDHFVGSAEDMCAGDSGVVVAGENIMMNVAVDLGHTLVSVAHISHLLVAAP